MQMLTLSKGYHLGPNFCLAGAYGMSMMPFMAWIQERNLDYWSYVAITPKEVFPTWADLAQTLDVEKCAKRYGWDAPRSIWVQQQDAPNSNLDIDPSREVTFNLLDAWFWRPTPQGFLRIDMITPGARILVAPGLESCPLRPKPMQDSKYKIDPEWDPEIVHLLRKSSISQSPSAPISASINITIKSAIIRDENGSNMCCHDPFKIATERAFVLRDREIITRTRSVPEDVVTNLLCLAEGKKLHFYNVKSGTEHVVAMTLFVEADTPQHIFEAAIDISSDQPFYLWRFSLSAANQYEYVGAYTSYQIARADVAAASKAYLRMRNTNCA